MKKFRGYIIVTAVSTVVGLVLKFALTGYGFLAYGFFAAALAALCYMALRALKTKHEKLSQTLNKILTYCIMLFLVVLAVTEGCLINEARAERDTAADYAIVLGAGVNGTEPSRSLTARLEAALAYADEFPDAEIVVSGGKGPGESITEAECMAQWLTARGVPENRIIMEDRAENTAENLSFSQELIEEAEPGFSGEICIITEGYHILRARMIAVDDGFESVTAKAAHTGLPVLTANYYLREAFAFWYYMLTR